MKVLSVIGRKSGVTEAVLFRMMSCAFLDLKL